MGNKIYKKLHGHIVGKGLTDKEVAAAIGISAQAMSDKIQGKTSFSLEQVVAIGTYLNFSDADYRKYFIIPQSIALGIASWKPLCPQIDTTSSAVVGRGSVLTAKMGLVSFLWLTFQKLY